MVFFGADQDDEDISCINSLIDFIVVEVTGNVGTIVDVVVDVAVSGIVIMYFAVQYAPKASNPVINKLK